MDHQTKMMIVDAVTNVVKSAPTKQNNSLFNGVTQESFDIWMRYVNSVLKITSQYIDINLIYPINTQIQNIVMQNKDNFSKTNDICDILLNFARTIIYL